MSRVFIDMDGVIVDFEAHMKALGMSGDECKRHPGAYLAMPAIPGALAAVRSIIGAGFEVWIATKPPTGVPFAYGDKAAWIMEHLPELKRRIIVTHHKGMLGRPGDWLIDDRPHKAYCSEFAGTLIQFGGTSGTGWPEALAVLGIGLGAKVQASPTNGVTTDPSDPRLTHGNDTTPVPQAPVYIVLADEERAKGFVRPVRRTYLHALCGGTTTMGQAIAETYARNPSFYGGTYCVHCQMHRPVGADGEFVWEDGSKVGT